MLQHCNCKLRSSQPSDLYFLDMIQQELLSFSSVLAHYICDQVDKQLVPETRVHTDLVNTNN